MTKTSKSLVFFGSGLVAFETLLFLSDIFDIETVVTKNNPAHHREPAPVEEYAKTNSINLLFADNQGELDRIFSKSKRSNRCGIVVDYGVIISKKVIDLFSLGIMNSHFSLLPEWRGADPITYSLLSGQNKTGVSLMLINEDLDDGPIIAQTIVPIIDSYTNESLTKKLISASNELLKTYIPPYLNGQIISSSQINNLVTYSRKIDKKDSYIDWGKPAPVLEREIRAFSTWPKSHCKIGALEVVVTSACAKKGSIPVGKWTIDGNRLQIGCRTGILEILELKPLGKNTMPTESFINGYSNRLFG